MAIRNVIFDFGGVLVRWNPREVVDAFHTDRSMRDSLMSSILQHPDWIELDRGTLDEPTALRQFSRRAALPVEQIASFLKHVRESLVAMPETLAIIHDLDRRGIKLYGLSNMAGETFAYLRARYDFWSVFQGIVISGEVKMVKPDPQIFEHICQLHSLVPVQTVFIDDNTPNIDTARLLGFQTILFETPKQGAAQLERLLG